MSRNPTPSGARRRPIMLTDHQLSALATFLVLYLDDFATQDGHDVTRIREIMAKADAELDRRAIDGPILYARDPIVGLPVPVVGPIRRGRR